MHNNLWKLCELLRNDNRKITLLSTGLLLRKFSKEIVDNIDEIIVSLDGSREVHNKIRNIPEAFEKLADGVSAVRELKPAFRITGRCVLQRFNYFDLGNIIISAKNIGLDQISFLPADISTEAFNHDGSLNANDISLTLEEAEELQRIIEQNKERFKSGFVAESLEKMRQIPKYYMALHGKGSFESPRCNAPWVSAVLESDGRLMPCFFHKEYGNVNGRDFLEVLNSKEAIQFRKNLKVKDNEVCKKCVCSLYKRPKWILF
jgi:MoaA/NifB/PqqE/SkfB family radical SAM enzyme